ncbi:hypothetical protein SAMN04487934_10615 [Eubacterium ruminantium]|nr:hypothetical protein SAMN04487934_10615 [Eubacterium ruminantium]
MFCLMTKRERFPSEIYVRRIYDKYKKTRQIYVSMRGLPQRRYLMSRHEVAENLVPLREDKAQAALE